MHHARERHWPIDRPKQHVYRRVWDVRGKFSDNGPFRAWSPGRWPARRPGEGRGVTLMLYNWCGDDRRLVDVGFFFAPGNLCTRPAPECSWPSPFLLIRQVDRHRLAGWADQAVEGRQGHLIDVMRGMLAGT